MSSSLDSTARSGQPSGGDWEEEVNQMIPNRVAEQNMNTSDWRGQLPPGSRQILLCKIVETLKRCLPPPGFSEEGLHQLWKLAHQFEQKMFTVATSQYDYLRKISMKMLLMEIRFRPQDTIESSALASNPEHSSDNF